MHSADTRTVFHVATSLSFFLIVFVQTFALISVFRPSPFFLPSSSSSPSLASSFAWVFASPANVSVLRLLSVRTYRQHSATHASLCFHASRNCSQFDLRHVRCIRVVRHFLLPHFPSAFDFCRWDSNTRRSGERRGSWHALAAWRLQPAPWERKAHRNKTLSFQEIGLLSNPLSPAEAQRAKKQPLQLRTTPERNLDTEHLITRLACEGNGPRSVIAIPTTWVRFLVASRPHA